MLANNHCCDAGVQGIIETTQAVEEAEEALKALGVVAEQKKVESTAEENVEANHVIRTDPEAKQD